MTIEKIYVYMLMNRLMKGMTKDYRERFYKYRHKDFYNKFNITEDCIIEFSITKNKRFKITIKNKSKKYMNLANKKSANHYYNIDDETAKIVAENKGNIELIAERLRHDIDLYSE